MKIRIRLSSILDMLNSLFSKLKLSNSCRDKVLHLLSTIEDSNGLLILIRIDLYLIDKFFIYHLEFRDYGKKSIQLSIQSFVVVQTKEMLFTESFLFGHDEIELVLLGAYVGLRCC